MGFIGQIEKIISSTKLPRNKIDLEDVKKYHNNGHFKKGYELSINYTSSSEIKEIVLREPSFEYIIYRHST